jgi:uncharacterized membrane protein
MTEEEKLEEIGKTVKWIKERMELDRKNSVKLAVALGVFGIAYTFLAAGMAVAVQNAIVASILVGLFLFIFAVAYLVFSIWKRESMKEIDLNEAKPTLQL